jgi:hypothetical protein
MRCRERVRDLNCVGQRVLDAESLLRNDGRQRHAVDILHRDEVDVSIAPDVVNGDDIRMVQRRGCACLLDETFPGFCADLPYGAEQLDRDRAP